MEEVVKNHSFTRSLDTELNALNGKKALPTIKNNSDILKKISKEMDYLEEMK
ncbi:MAG: hypothetical protein LBD75_01280 [Candidatus Peribacteria bacterium]|jgi:hypothetical protein|nr:hypothetical protein [Candidatus Peribacteria bacterium]